METNSDSTQAEKQTVEQIIAGRTRIQTELAKVIVGQSDVIEQLLIALFAGGHCLITGAPGLAKTLLVKSIAQIFHLKFQRIQFTPDLMPADITGTEILQDTGQSRRMVFVPGPIFANMILADEMVRYAVRLAAASRRHQNGAPDFANEWVSWGAGLRAGQYLVLGAEVRALIHGRAHVTVEDIQALAHPTLRHRILLNYRAEAEGVTVENVVERLLQTVKGVYSTMK